MTCLLKTCGFGLGKMSTTAGPYHSPAPVLSSCSFMLSPILCFLCLCHAFSLVIFFFSIFIGETFVKASSYFLENIHLENQEMK